jgi:hypothetical protein
VQHESRLYEARFHFLTAASTEILVVWDVAPCSRHPDDGGSKNLCETSVNYQTTRRSIPESSHLQLCFFAKLLVFPFLLTYCGS